MKFVKIEGSNVPRWVNFSAVRFLWIEEYDEDFCERYDAEERFYVMAEHDIYLRGFKTYAEAEAYLNELIEELRQEG